MSAGSRRTEPARRRGLPGAAAGYREPGRYGSEGRTCMTGDGAQPEGPMGAPPSRRARRRYFVLMTICVGLFVMSWAVVDRYSTVAAIVLSAVALVIPPFAAIVANAASAIDRRRQ